MDSLIKERYKYSEITSVIIGSAMEVHNILGPGFQEVIYQRALAIEMDSRKLSFSREHDERWLSVTFEPVESLENPVSLFTIKNNQQLQNIGLVKQQRLAVMPLKKEEFELIKYFPNEPHLRHRRHSRL